MTTKSAYSKLIGDAAGRYIDEIPSEPEDIFKQRKRPDDYYTRKNKDSFMENLRKIRKAYLDGRKR